MNEEHPLRYRRFMGLATLVERFAKGEFTLTEIAALIGYTRETVRNDFKKHLGEMGYKKLILLRKNARVNKTIVRLDTAAAQLHLARLAKGLSGAEAHERLIQKKVLELAETEGVRIVAQPNKHTHRIMFFLENERSVQIRAAIIDGKKFEHSIGFHRFKINPAIESYDYVIFALAMHNRLLTFIFMPSEISHLRSLNLRFMDECKYNITRTSKYDYARDRWSLLN